MQRSYYGHKIAADQEVKIIMQLQATVMHYSKPRSHTNEPQVVFFRNQLCMGKALVIIFMQKLFDWQYATLS